MTDKTMSTGEPGTGAEVAAAEVTRSSLTTAQRHIVDRAYRHAQRLAIRDYSPGWAAWRDMMKRLCGLGVFVHYTDAARSAYQLTDLGYKLGKPVRSRRAKRASR